MLWTIIVILIVLWLLGAFGQGYILDSPTPATPFTR